MSEAISAEEFATRCPAVHAETGERCDKPREHGDTAHATYYGFDAHYWSNEVPR